MDDDQNRDSLIEGFDQKMKSLDNLLQSEYDK